MNSLGSRIVGTVVVGICWLVFVLLFFAFYAVNFEFWQIVAIFLVSVIISGGIVAVMWIEWAFK